jgi:predicted hotdog family 3-hydroxylacyl-ACP dehydratase
MQMTSKKLLPLFPVEDVVPHSGRMVLLDRLTTVEEGRLTAEVVLRADSMFVRNGKARGIVTVEYMAQAVAAYVGTLSCMKKEPVEIGYLIGIREMKIAVDHVEAGDVLEIEVQHVFGNDQLGSFKTTTTRNGEMIADATLTVYRGALPEGVE